MDTDVARVPAENGVLRPHSTRGWRWVPILCVPLLAAACGGVDAEPTPTTAPTVAPTATLPPNTPTTIPDPEIGAIVWATGVEPGTNAPNPEVRRFATEAPAIYAVVRVSNLRPDSVITAAWTYNDTPLDGATRAAVLQAAFAGGWLEFHLGRDAGTNWPAGSYGVAISLDGVVVQTAEVDVS